MNLFQNLNNFNGNMINPLQFKGFANSMSIIIAVAIFAVSIVHCFYGYKLLKWWTSFIGFVLFGIVGYGFYYNFKGDPSNSVICGIVIGVIGAFISFSLYKIGVVIISLGAGFLAGYMISESVQTAAVFGVICGILVLLFMKPVLITTIAVSSGILAGRNLAVIVGADSDISTMISVVLAILGTLFQWKSNIGRIGLRKSRNKNKRRKIRDKKPLDFSINGIKDAFYKLKNKISFDDDNDDEEDDYDYYEDNTEFIPVDNKYSSGDKTVFMPKYDKKSEQESEETKLLKKINEKAKDEININDILNEEPNVKSEDYNNSKNEMGVRCPRCNNLCSTYDKFCNNCGEKLIR